jgi:hypothetical protein
MRHVRLGIVTLVFLVTGVTRALAAGGTCDFVEFGIDTSVAKFAEYALLGEAAGETITCPETVVTGFTVYRPALIPGGGVGYRLFVVPTDSLGQPLVTQFINDSWVAPSVDGDGQHPTPIHFDLDPPILLPRPGVYEFAIGPSPCGGDIRYLYSTHDEYAGGVFVEHGRSACTLANWPGASPTTDLIFRIEFCGPPNTTTTRAVTWGSVKAVYR